MNEPLHEIVAIVTRILSDRSTSVDAWRPKTEGYFDSDTERADRAVPAPILIVDDWNFLFVLFVPHAPPATKRAADDVLRDVTTHLALLFRSLRDLEMNRLLVGMIYSATSDGMANLQAAIGELGGLHRTHRLLLLPPIDDEHTGRQIESAIRPLLPITLEPFLRPIESEKINTAVLAVLDESAKDRDIIDEVTEDIRQFLPQMSWASDGPWPRLKAHIARTVASSLGATDE